MIARFTKMELTRLRIETLQIVDEANHGVLVRALAHAAAGVAVFVIEAAPCAHFEAGQMLQQQSICNCMSEFLDVWR